MNDFIEFLKTPTGQMVSRFGTVVFFSSGAWIFIHKISERVGLYKHEKRKKKISFVADITGYLSNIGLSIAYSWFFWDSANVAEGIAAGVFYGLSCITAQSVILSDRLINIIKIILRIKK
jgi:hypothetical protein